MTEAIKKTDLIQSRPIIPDDLNFIYATWLPALYHGNDWFGEIERSIYYEYYYKIIETILARPSTKVFVACLKDEPDVILGYSVSDKTTLHFVFVKSVWRKIGIAKSLVPKNVDAFTHATKQGLQFMKHNFPNAKFNPFL